MKFINRPKKTLAAILSVLTITAPLSTMQTGSAHAVSNAERVVEYAKSKTYITSRPNEVTRFYGVTCDWCSMFVYYCAYQTGLGNSVPNTTFCDSQYGYKGGVEVFKSWNKWRYSYAMGGSYVPVKGDIIYFDWNLDGYSDHVGFVDYVSGGYVHTVEGNAGPNGDRVKLNQYSLSYRNILGYGTPDYGGNTTATVSTKKSYEFPAIFKVTSPVGGWLRETGDLNGKKLGILSTDQKVYADKMHGDWIHIVSTSVENSSVKYSGWTAASNVEFVSKTTNEQISKLTATTTKATTTTTTTTTSSTTTKPKTTTTTSAATTTTTTSDAVTSSASTTTAYTAKADTSASTAAVTTTTAAPVPAEKPQKLYRVSSPVGARFRSEPSFEDNTIGILDTDDTLYAVEIDREWVYANVTLDGGQTYRKGYIHLSTLTSLEYASSKSNDTPMASSGNTNMYRVTSPIGCRFRRDPEITATNTLAILDTDTTIEVLGVYSDWAFARISTDVPNLYKYGYVHTSNIEKA